MIAILLTKILFLSVFSISASENSLSCIRLENLEIGCVPSVDHSCRKNKAVDKENVPCNYVADPGVSIRVEGPISWKCAVDPTVTQVCTDNCNSDGCSTTCRVTSTCERYEPPICHETCVDCFNTVVTANVGVEKGCVVCTRALCSDEVGRQARIACPATYGGMVHHPGFKCSANQRCPTTAIDPNGQSHSVTVPPVNCQPPQMPNPPQPSQPQLCPWKEDERTGGRPPGPNDPGDPGNCEDITEDNRNP